MLTLITGGSKTGRSALGEKLLSQSDGEKIYIATMMPFGEEAARTIEHHRQIRSGKGFVTKEVYYDLHTADIPQKSSVLIEDAVNLLANEIFEKNEQDPVGKILSAVGDLAEKCGNVIVITSTVELDRADYTAEVKDYVRKLGAMGCGLAAIADSVYETVFGIPVLVSGHVRT